MISLNPEQRRAVEHGDGPLLVIAGPGTGKTRVISERILFLLDNVPELAPREVLALTYTDKAAAEMRRRLSKEMHAGRGGGRQPGAGPQISTFHAFCYRALCEQTAEEELKASGRHLLDEIDVWIFLRRRMEALKLQHYQKLAEPGAFLHDLNDFFSRCQDELVEPEHFQAYVAQLEQAYREHAASLDPQEQASLREQLERQQELARVFHVSRLLIESAGYASFGTLISEMVGLWDRNPRALTDYQGRFRYVLVDEFQDTNFAQVELLRRLVPLPYNITAVGDDDQAIYRFRGASHGTFKMFDAAFPTHATVWLDRNYRSTRKILRVAGAVILGNERYENKPLLHTDNPEGANACLLESISYETEAAWIAGEIERLIKRGRGYAEIAVLYRAHSHRDRLVREFRRRRIPFSIRGLSILATSVLRDLLAYLRLIHSPHDNISLTRVLLAPHWRFPEELALEARKQAARNRSSLYTAIKVIEQSLFGAEVRCTGWSGLDGMLHDLRDQADSLPVTALYDRLLERLGFGMCPSGCDQGYLDRFRAFLREWEAKHRAGFSAALRADEADTEPGEGTPAPLPTLRDFMEYFQYFLDAGGVIEAPEPDEHNSVQMMTVHSAKGLEFPVVFVVSVARQRFPHREERPVIEFPDELRKGPPTPADIHLQEERRLFYVALTRAQERLYVSSVIPSTGRGGKPSFFIDDLLSNPAVTAQDIERIEVRPVETRAIPAKPVAGQLDSAPMPQTPAERRTAPEQGSLFPDPAEAAQLLRPNVIAWAMHLPDSLVPQDNIRLSATAIETYRDCPLKFKFTYYRRIPTGPQAALTFGSVMHRSVRQYFKARQDGPQPSFEDLRDFYLRSWRDLGFEDTYQEQMYKKSGLDQLQAFFERHQRLALPFADIRTEESFQVDLGDILLDGRVDQINPLTPVPSPSANASATAARPERSLFALAGEALAVRESGDGRQSAPNVNRRSDRPLPVELIDYKTGRPRQQKDADKSLQLSVYALAARRQWNLDPVRLTFYNLTNNEPVSTVRTAKQLDKAVNQVREVAAEIRSRKFDPKPGFGCRFCEFVPICPAHEESPEEQ
jgi:DNA helicase-2/ATP-dependent DNA helicase PcrA